MSEVPQQFSVLPQLPAVIPPTSRLNFLKNWWQRSDKTSAIAEARLLHRISQSTLSLKAPVPIVANLLRVPLDDNEPPNTKSARLVNTLHLKAAPDQKAPFVLNTEENDIESIKDKGDSKNLVICHGYGAGLGFFYKNFYALSQAPGWQIFAIDWLGMGRSSRPKWTIVKKANETWDQIITDVEDHFVGSLEDWRKRVGIEKMTLMGHSLGGYFATCYALRYPARVEKLILVSPAGIPERPPELGPPPKEEGSPQEVLDKEAAEIGVTMQASAASAENMALADQSASIPQEPPSAPVRPARRIPSWATYLWEHNITPMSIVRLSGPFGASLVNSYTSRRFAHLSTDERHDLYDYLYNITSSSGSGEYALAAILAPGAYARRPLIKRLNGLQMPTVFIYGEQDWMDYKAAEKAKKEMKVPVKIIRTDGGHHMYLDNPQEFNNALLEELNRGV